MLRDFIRRSINEEIDRFCFNTMLVEIDAVSQAKDFSRQTHKGQFRTSSKLPYIVHPMRVYYYTKKLGLSKRHQVLALLHDTYEDSRNPKETLRKIKELFGSKIANSVVMLSHDKGINYNEYLLSMATRFPTIFDVKLLDILDNVKDKPQLKQKNKYKKSIEYLLQRGIKFNPKIKDKLFKLIGIQEMNGIKNFVESIVLEILLSEADDDDVVKVSGKTLIKNKKGNVYFVKNVNPEKHTPVKKQEYEKLKKQGKVDTGVDIEKLSPKPRSKELRKKLVKEFKKDMDSKGLELSYRRVLGRIYPVGIDNVGDKIVYDWDGQQYQYREFWDLQLERRSIEKKINKIHDIDLYLKSIPRETDDLINNLKEDKPISYEFLTDNQKIRKKLTRSYPVIEHNNQKLIVDGRFKGYYLEDMINRIGRHVAGTGYVMDENGMPRPIEYKEDNITKFRVQNEPYLTKMDNGKYRLVFSQDDKNSRKKLLELTKLYKTINFKKRLNCVDINLDDFDVVNDVLGGMSMSETASIDLIKSIKNKKRLAEIEANRTYDHISTKNIPGMKTKREFMAHQKKSIAVVTERKGNTIVGLDTGTGKTAVAFGIIQTWINDGTLKKGGRNGKALVVCRSSLKGNFPAQAKEWLDDTKKMDVVTYGEFRKNSEKYKKYGAIFFDEAQQLRTTRSKVTKAALQFNHPIKVPLTASVLEKALTLNSLVLTPSGWKRMGDIKVGDKVLTPTGKISTVLEVNPQGIRPTYKVSFTDGSSVEAGEGHLWATNPFKERSEKERIWKNGKKINISLSDRLKTRKYDNISTTLELKNTLYHNNTHKNHQIPMVNNIEFEQKEELIINPYLLGVLLGDGSFTDGTPNITCHDNDKFIIDTIINEGYIQDQKISIKNKKLSKCKMYKIVKGDDSNNTWIPNPLTEKLKKLNLYGKTGIDKFIPNQYLFSSINDRLELLRGLMDTDGFISINGGNIQFCNTSKNLVYGVKHIVESLGGTVRLSDRIPKYKYKGEVKSGKVAYYANIMLNENPFKLPRKANRFRIKTTKFPARYVKNVEYVGNKELQCISIDDPEGLFITNNFIVTHNSPMDLFNLIAIAKNKGKKSEELKRDAQKFVKTFCVKVGGKVVGLKSDATTQKKFREWVKANTLYVDKVDVEETSLPDVTPVKDRTESLQMNKKIQEKYEEMSKPIRDTLQRMVEKYKDKSLKTTDINQEISRVMGQIQHLKSFLNTPEEFIDGIKNPKISRAIDVVEERLQKNDKAKTITFTDSPRLAIKSGIELSKNFPHKKHVVALADRIEIYKNGKKIQTFNKNSNLKDRDGNPIPKEEWQVHLISKFQKSRSVSTVNLTSAYTMGHNIQSADFVLHYDRNSWNNEHMKQRNARVWRTGQTKPVGVKILDLVNDSGTSLDNIQKFSMEIEQKLFDDMIKKAKDMKLDDKYNITDVENLVKNREMLEYLLNPTLKNSFDIPNEIQGEKSG